MENFKQIAEDCLSGKLSGRFVCRDGLHISSYTLRRTDNPLYPYKLYRAGQLNKEGRTPNKHSHNDIIQFIPYQDMKPKQITIDIPEGKVPIMEQTDNGVTITWTEKELTYTELLNEFRNNLNCIHTNFVNSASQTFYKKVEVLRKLTNIRNYFGKPKVSYDGVVITYEFNEPIIVSAKVCPRECSVIFAKKEHAEQAIKMLGDELKYLFEPW